MSIPRLADHLGPAAVLLAALVAAGTVMAAPPTAPAKAQTTTPPPPPPPSQLACSQDRLEGLKDAPAGALRGALIPAANVLPANATGEFIYVQPAGQTVNHLEFRVFLAPPVKAGETSQTGGSLLSVLKSLTTDKAPELNVLTVANPPAPVPDFAKGFAADNRNLYDIKVTIPSEDAWNKTAWPPHHQRSLYVVACDRQLAASGSRDVAVGYAVTPIIVSNKLAAGIIAAGVMILIYLFACLLKALTDRPSSRRVTTLKNRFSAAHGQRNVRVSHRGAQISWFRYFDPVVLSADIFNRACLSQLQMLTFLMLVGYGVTFSVVRTGTLSDLSSSIVYLLGIPALGAVGNQLATAQKDRFSLDNWSWLVSHHVLTVDDPGTGDPQWRDLLSTNGHLDLYKLQAFAFSFIVAVAMVYSGFTSLDTFTVPQTMLQIMGLSQVVFVGGRLAMPATVSDIDSLITELRTRADTLRVAAASGVDVDSNGKPVGTPPPGAGVNVVTNIADARKYAPNAVARYLETASEVDVLLKGLTYRDVVTDQLKDPYAWDLPAQPPAKKTPPGPPPVAPPPPATA